MINVFESDISCVPREGRHTDHGGTKLHFVNSQSRDLQLQPRCLYVSISLLPSRIRIYLELLPSISLLVPRTPAASPIVVASPAGEVSGRYSHLVIGDIRSPWSVDHLSLATLLCQIEIEEDVLSRPRKVESDISSFRGFTNPLPPSIA